MLGHPPPTAAAATAVHNLIPGPHNTESFSFRTLDDDNEKFSLAKNLVLINFTCRKRFARLKCYSNRPHHPQLVYYPYIYIFA